MGPSLAFLHFLFFFSVVAHASITVYYQTGQAAITAASSTSAAAANYTGAAAYNPTILEPPSLPDPLPAMNFDIQLQNGGTPGVSIKQTGAFLGFSIEMSVTNQLRKLPVCIVIVFPTNTYF